MGLKIAARRKEEKLRFQHGPVKIEGGPGCEYERGERRELKAEDDDDEQRKDASNEPEKTSPKPELDEPGEERVEEKREERKEEREEKREEKQGDKNE